MGPMMKRIVILNSRGGNGATSVAANLTCGLHNLGLKTHIIDANPHNLLRLHFAMPIEESDGWSKHLLNNQHWTDVAYQSPTQISFVPFGDLTAEQKIQFEHHCQLLPNGLAGVFDQLSQSNNPVSSDVWQIVLLPSFDLLRPYHMSLIEQAELVLCVAKPDFQHYVWLPRSTQFGAIQSLCSPYVLLNMYDPANSNSRDMQLVFRRELDALVPVSLHLDNSMIDALANLSLVQNYAPFSQATKDYNALSFWCLSQVQSRTEINHGFNDRFTENKGDLSNA